MDNMPENFKRVVRNRAQHSRGVWGGGECGPWMWACVNLFSLRGGRACLLRQVRKRQLQQHINSHVDVYVCVCLCFSDEGAHGQVEKARLPKS